MLYLSRVILNSLSYRQVSQSRDSHETVLFIDVASQCQGHVHWIIGFAISIMSKMASCKYARVRSTCS